MVHLVAPLFYHSLPFIIHSGSPRSMGQVASKGVYDSWYLAVNGW